MGEDRVVCGFCKVEPQDLTYGNDERELICLKCVSERDQRPPLRSPTIMRPPNGRCEMGLAGSSIAGRRNQPKPVPAFHRLTTPGSGG